MFIHSFRSSSKAVTASLIALATLSLGAVASAQIPYPVYSENFSTGYSIGDALSDNINWGTNDRYTGGRYTYNVNQTGVIGQSDFVGYQANLSLTASDYVGFLGGGFGQQIAPGVAATTGPVTVSRALPTASATNVVFSTDYQVTNPNGAFPSHDSFAFALTGASGNLISINFVPNSTNSTSIDNITYTNAAGVASAPVAGMNLGSLTRYRLTVSVNVTAGTFGATYQAENITTGALTGVVGTLAPTGTAYGTGAITGLAVTWTLADKTTGVLASNLGLGANQSGTNNFAHTNAGINALYFDNILVTVPEPSTYAMVVLGVIGLAVMIRRSRHAQVA